MMVITKKLQKDLDKRLSAKEALEHPWFEKFGGRSLFNLEKIEAEIYELQKQDETFTPVINHRKGEHKERRSLNDIGTSKESTSPNRRGSKFKVVIKI